MNSETRFQTLIPFEKHNLDRVSLDLYDWIVERGGQIDKPSKNDDWSYDFYVNLERYQIETTVGFVGIRDDQTESNEPVDWLIVTTLHESILQRIFRRESLRTIAVNQYRQHLDAITTYLESGEFANIESDVSE